MKLIALASLTVLAALAGCRSSAAPEADFPCICGTPEAAMESCLQAQCARGENNPENPDCACGTLSFGHED